MEYLHKIISTIAGLFTIMASSIAIYLFFVKKDEISKVFNLLLNYSYQLTLSELKEKLERLNDNNAKDPDDLEQIINILHEVMGQIRGNDQYTIHFADQLNKIEKLVTNKRSLTEPRKRALVSELREKIRHLNIKKIDEMMGVKK